MPERASVTVSPVEFEDQPQHAVGGRVLRTHVDHDRSLLDTVVAADLIPVATADGEDLALGVS
jgi:hypothetical protein